MKKKILIPLITVGVLLVLVLATGAFLWWNDFHIDFTVNGQGEITQEYGGTYTDPGAVAIYRGKLLLKEGKALEVSAENPVDPAKTGSYTILYKAQKGKQVATATRTVKIVDTQAPTLTLKGTAEMSLVKGNTFEDPGFTATDGYDGDLAAKVAVTGEVNTRETGDYTLTYTVADAAGNSATATRKVTVRNPVVRPQSVTPPETGTVVPGNKTVYLTFDDGPGPYTEKLLNVLAKYNAKATFFVTNNRPAYNHLFSRMAQDGHAVAIHTASHNYKKIYASEEAFYADLNEISDVIQQQTGIKPMLTRFPGGSSNTVSRFNPGIMTRLAADLEAKGYRYFDWNVDSNDAGGASSTSEVVNNIKRGIAANSVSIVLQHDIKGFSVDAVDEVLRWGTANGYTFKALDSTSPTMRHGINN